jgi:hypothetical protein
VKQGFHVYEVYIYLDKSGQTSFGKVNLRDASVVRSYAKVILAGPVAELFFMGLPVTKDNLADLEGASSDIAKAGAFAQQYDLTGVLEETVAMVKASKDAIVAVAAKLMKDGSVEGDELGGMI